MIKCYFCSKPKDNFHYILYNKSCRIFHRDLSNREVVIALYSPTNFQYEIYEYSIEYTKQNELRFIKYNYNATSTLLLELDYVKIPTLTTQAHVKNEIERLLKLVNLK